MATERSGRRIKRSLILDADMIPWIVAKAKAEDLSESQLVRRFIRAAMNAEADADAEQVA
jgi:hypothetical protein